MAEYLQIRDPEGRKAAHYTVEDGEAPPELPEGWCLEPADDTPLHAAYSSTAAVE